MLLPPEVVSHQPSGAADGNRLTRRARRNCRERGDQLSASRSARWRTAPRHPHHQREDHWGRHRRSRCAAAWPGPPRARRAVSACSASICSAAPRTCSFVAAGP